jgi:hypothetical protein
MPDSGIYEHEARPDSWRWLMRTLRSRSDVSEIEKLDRFRLAVKRRLLNSVTLYVCNIYQLGVADVEEILEEYSGIDAIVTVSAWNRYSPQAKELANECNIGLFKPNELMGALYKEGHQFVEHLPVEQRAELRRKDHLR